MVEKQHSRPTILFFREDPFHSRQKANALEIRTSNYYIIICNSNAIMAWNLVLS